MRVHLVQYSLLWEEPDANFARVREMVGSAGVAGGDLVVLPEMFDTGFSFNLARTSDARGEALAFLGDLARELRATVHGGRTIVNDAGKGLNLASVHGPEGPLCEYAKIHPFSFGRESEFFVGGTGVAVYDWRSRAGTLRVCPAVCYDLRFPELFRVGLTRGAEAFSIGANWPASRAHHWRALAVARAIENQAFVFAVNRTGNDPHLAYAGGSIVVGPKGDVLGELKDEERVLSVEIRAADVADWRETFPAWRDGRVGLEWSDQ